MPTWLSWTHPNDVTDYPNGGVGTARTEGTGLIIEGNMLDERVL